MSAKNDSDKVNQIKQWASNSLSQLKSIENANQINPFPTKNDIGSFIDHLRTQLEILIKAEQQQFELAFNTILKLSDISKNSAIQDDTMVGSPLKHFCRDIQTQYQRIGYQPSVATVDESVADLLSQRQVSGPAPPMAAAFSSQKAQSKKEKTSSPTPSPTPEPKPSQPTSPQT